MKPLATVFAPVPLKVFPVRRWVFAPEYRCAFFCLFQGWVDGLVEAGTFGGGFWVTKCRILFPLLAGRMLSFGSHFLLRVKFFPAAHPLTHNGRSLGYDATRRGIWVGQVATPALRSNYSA